MKLFEIQQNRERSILSVMGPQPSHYEGDFACFNNKLTSLVGAPRSVSGRFNCSNNNLISVEHAPQFIGGDFVCYTNPIISFHDIHNTIKHIGGDFFCNKAKHMLGIALIKGITKVFIINDKKLEKIFNKYLHDISLLQEALIDAGYRAQAQV